ncbi:hypothetical protein KSP40_PGU005216 [Platanthera guangdongensis]|uniref:Uncharacterized protein n=1 Tax=Platanthera guangdongensis TaxID=2320717 RepID=A0ABR2MAY1_9ASPA
MMHMRTTFSKFFPFGNGQIKRWRNFCKLGDITRLIFCDICIREIDLGNRPTTHFNKEDWGNLVKNFIYVIDVQLTVMIEGQGSSA